MTEETVLNSEDDPTPAPADDQTLPDDALVQTIQVLEQIAADRGHLARLSREQRQRLVRAAECVARPDRKSRKQLVRAFKRQDQAERAVKKAQDEQQLARTGIRRHLGTRQVKRPCPPAPFEPELPPAHELPDDAFIGRLNIPRSCYICKREFDRIHFFYDALCPDCAALNWQRRQQTYDLSGRFAMVTGGRVKIGYHAALKLLRAGCHVVVTTRFPHDAATRFTAEPDSGAWIDRLQLHGIDLRHTPSVEALADHLCDTLPRLDFLLNNACQTVRRPPGFYAHLMEGERRLADSLSNAARKLLASHDSLRRRTGGLAGSSALPVPVDRSLAGIQQAAELSQIPLVADDLADGNNLFPAGQLDGDLQQVDLRPVNSWRLKLAEVETVELLEVQLVNAIAPFILNARLKPLMQKDSTGDRHIVNVSAMEGVFYRAYKTDRHPHTNMAKAALNMLTRTSARDCIRDGIHMNSVDTGWITDEDPADIAQRKTEELGFHPPLDQIDAAARICDPIFHGFLTGNHVWGQFLKDYQIANW